MKKISYTAKAGDILKLGKIKFSKKNFYVQFSKDGKKGWIKLENKKSLFYGVEKRLAS